MWRGTRRLAIVLVALALPLASACAPGGPRSAGVTGPPPAASAASAQPPVTEELTPKAQPAPATPPVECDPDEDNCKEHVTLTSGAKFTVQRNYPLAGSPAINAAIVVVHGAGRNPVSTLLGMWRAARAAGADDHTLIVAPFFETDEDDPATGVARWTDDGWKAGDDAVQPAGLSSFSVMDSLLSELADKSRWPNLKRITLAGHSAGGQFTQRYAAAGQAPSVLRGVSIDFVVANPSSYLYLEPNRPTGSGNNFAIPKASCQYNKYKYGLDGRPPYLQRMTDDQIVHTFTSRQVTYLLGDADTTPAHDFDDSCEAMLQGSSRFQRGTLYYNRIHDLFPHAPQKLVVVPAVGHNHYAIFESEQANHVLFGPSS
jgi:pimeloyl-ACP methyl ester carboxylesterase